MATIYFSIGVDSWKFSFVGDEWAFYTYAKNLRFGFDNLFLLSGAYPDSPTLGSIYQSLVMHIFGNNNFGWRMSNIVIIIPLSVFFFLWIRNIFGSVGLAFVSSLLMQTSFYLANFFKIGKPIPLSLLLFIMILYYGSIIRNKKNNVNLIITGLLLGISFYIYIGPVFPVIIFPYLIFIYFRQNYNLWKILTNILIILTAYFIILLPAIYQITHSNSYLHEAFKKTVVKREFVGYWQVVVNIGHGFLLFFKNYDYSFNHFVTGPYLDVITRILTLVGIIVLIASINKKGRLIFALTYITTVVVIGATSPYAYSPTTRGIFYLPFGFGLSGLGLYWLIHFVGRKIRLIILIILFFTIFSINLYQSQINTFKSIKPNQTSHIIKKLQEGNQNNIKNLSLLLAQDSPFNYQNIITMKEAYGLNMINFTVIEDTPLLSCHSLRSNMLLLLNEDKLLIEKVKKLNCQVRIELL